MKYGICHLSMVPLRSEPSGNCGMTNQMLYGEIFEILEIRQEWARICTTSFEGWLDKKQFLPISEETHSRKESETTVFMPDLMEFVSDENQTLIPIPLGSVLNYLPDLGHHYDGSFAKGKKGKENFLKTALLYLNAPFLFGGRSPFGIDASGLTYMVYRLNGYPLFREVTKQASQGESLSFIEESEPGDLAFFDNAEGEIDHVGIMMNDNYIIHAYGKVRIDRIDHSGIFNPESGRHTHQLRVIKKVI